MFNWYNQALDVLNLLIILAVAGFLVRDICRLKRRYHRRVFCCKTHGVGEG